MMRGASERPVCSSGNRQLPPRFSRPGCLQIGTSDGSIRPEIHWIAGHSVSPRSTLDHPAACAIILGPQAIFG